ncbi:unnamed protein product [Arabidopsis lyrata]|uniref:Predicted protein n=1 Tax=Arabidopsis lyrata subsp. lyrata TaxID=81972 RepID=D7KY61_ARALL|nr:predicted protein [Arabidopsis lyrata subsp. lyrata]CAH8256507.1 unnamed protein product [Arabidopsis lyrata]
MVPHWERLSTNIRSHNVIRRTSANNNSIDNVLSLSFEELPSYLKHYFLYLAHFPEDYAIVVEDLAYYWAAEGIPRPRYYDGATIRQVADGYIEELVKRNMVISKRDARTSRFETCQLHDVMREVCLLKVKEGNSIHTVEIRASTATSQSLCKSCKIALHQLDRSYDPKWEMRNPKLKSLLLIKKKSWEKNRMTSRLCFTRLQLMRVLDLSYAVFKGGKLPSSIAMLIHLRYLSLSEAIVTHLPSSMWNLKQLLDLNLDVKGRLPTHMPDFMKEMRELTYLCSI